MAITITTPRSASVSLAAGDTLYITGQGVATFGPGPWGPQTATIDGAKTMGPYPEARTINLCASASDLSYWTDAPDAPGSEPVMRDRATNTLSPFAQEAVMGASASLTSGQWYSVPAFCQITLTGTGSYSYSTRNAAGTVTAGGSGTCPDTAPVYMGSDTQISVTFPATATAKVN